MMQEYNVSKHYTDNLSFDTVYSDKTQILQDTQKLIQDDSYNNCCDRICIWWFFHSSPGIETYEENFDDIKYKFMCCNCCTWCLECKYNYKCCITKIGCCCFTILFE